MNYQEADAKLQGRCYQLRKIGNNSYLQRRGEAIALLYHSTDVVTFFSDGSIQVSTGGWNTITTRERINWVLPRPWHVYGERGATILSNYRWISVRRKYGSEYVRRGTQEAVLSNSAIILPNGKIQGGESAQASREQIRLADNETNRLRSRLRYWIRKAREHKPSRLTAADILKEENTQIRAAKIHAYGFDRYLVESKVAVVDIHGDYALLNLPLTQWESMKALKMRCPSTGAVYINAVPPQVETIADALDFMFDTKDYLSQVTQQT
jgi:hypothetical protein